MYWKLQKGYEYKGIQCKGTKSYLPKSYFPKSITNCDKKVPCSQNKYKKSSLYYKDCSVIGYVNCGIGACAVDSRTCKNSIKEMILDILKGIVDFITFCFSLGISSGVHGLKEIATNGLKKAGEKGVKVFAKFKDKIKEVLTSAAKQAARDLFI